MFIWVVKGIVWFYEVGIFVKYFKILGYLWYLFGELYKLVNGVESIINKVYLCEWVFNELGNFGLIGLNFFNVLLCIDFGV